MPTLPDLIGLPGLHVDFGHYSVAAGRWVWEPTADFTCRAGCHRTAAGPADVAQFCRAITAWHILHCPARKST